MRTALCLGDIQRTNEYFTIDLRPAHVICYNKIWLNRPGHLIHWVSQELLKYKKKKKIHLSAFGFLSFPDQHLLLGPVIDSFHQDTSQQ